MSLSILHRWVLLCIGVFINQRCVTVIINRLVSSAFQSEFYLKCCIDVAIIYQWHTIIIWHNPIIIDCISCTYIYVSFIIIWYIISTILSYIFFLFSNKDLISSKEFIYFYVKFLFKYKYPWDDFLSLIFQSIKIILPCCYQ